jgi:geranyl-CoA carboxylase beta subunit
MNVFQSKLNTKSEAFAINRADMLALVERMRAYESRAESLSEKRRDRFEERGQLTPRERLTRLLDPGMPFLELYNMANFLMEDTDPDTSVPGGSQIAGIGFINGTRCMVLVDDSGIKAGSATASTVPKSLGVLDIAIEQKLPFVHLVESAGGNLLTYKVEQWAYGGRMFMQKAQLSAAGIPTFVVLHGPSTAGGAYQPGMSDYVIGVKDNGMAALAGAALVRAATGEIADDRTLGGAEMHASVTGLVEYLADDDAHGLLTLRNLIKTLDWNKNCPLAPRRDFDEPLYDTEELAGLVPVDYKKAYDVREVVARVVDGSEFMEFKPGYGTATVCVQASIFGHACGLIGNNGPIDPNGATKAAQFMQLCDSANIPVIFLNNTTGYMVGTEYEHAGMIKHGSKMVQAVSNIRVPRITLYIGASFGAGNYGMCGLGYEPDFLLTWPNAETGIMGGESAAATMELVARVTAKRRGVIPDEKMLTKQRETIINHFDRQSGAFYTSGHCLDQGIIDPRDTRKILGLLLDTVWEGRNRELQPNTFGVGRL